MVIPDQSAPTRRPGAGPPRSDDPDRGSRHGPVAQLLIAWSPLSVILLVYAVAGWVSAPIDVRHPRGGTNRLGFSLHLQVLPDIDKAAFGAVPSVWLQQRFASDAPHWYDAVAALVYITHLVAIPLLTAAVWFRWRDRFARLVTTVVAFTVLGVGGYVVFPAAPPWLASDHDVIGAVDRSSASGWEYLHLGAVERLVLLAQGDSNPVATMPSLHAGAAMLAALVLWPVATLAWRAVLVLYVGLMAVTLVYTGEHYVVDVVVGWLIAGAAVVIGLLPRSSILSSSSRPSSAPFPPFVQPSGDDPRST